MSGRKGTKENERAQKGVCCAEQDISACSSGMCCGSLTPHRFVLDYPRMLSEQGDIKDTALNRANDMIDDLRRQVCPLTFASFSEVEREVYMCDGGGGGGEGVCVCMRVCECICLARDVDWYKWRSRLRSARMQAPCLHFECLTVGIFCLLAPPQLSDATQKESETRAELRTATQRAENLVCAASSIRLWARENACVHVCV